MKTMLIIFRHDCILLYNFCLLIMKCDQSLDLSYIFACFYVSCKIGCKYIECKLFLSAEGKNCLYLLAVHVALRKNKEIQNFFQ